MIKQARRSAILHRMRIINNKGRGRRSPARENGAGGVAGAILAQSSPEEIMALSRFGEHLGLAFQIQDDILDVTGTSEELGKTAGKDESSEKSTYPGLLTLPKAKEKLEFHASEALRAIDSLNGDLSLLRELTELIVQRKN